MRHYNDMKGYIGILIPLVCCETLTVRQDKRPKQSEAWYVLESSSRVRNLGLPGMHHGIHSGYEW